MKTIGILTLLLLIGVKGFAQTSADSVKIDSVYVTEEIKNDSVLVPVSDSLVNLAISTKNTLAPVISKPVVNPVNTKVINRFMDFLAQYRKERQVMSDRWNDIFIPHAPSWIRSNPDYYKLSMPATYYSAAIEQAMSIEDWEPKNPYIAKNPVCDSVFQVPHLTHTEDVDRAINKQLLSFYVQYPNLVRKNENDLAGLEPNGYMQFSQNYISDNWYKGGESTVSLLSGMTWQFNYDDKQKIQFENKIEWKLGFITAPSDTVHQYKTSEDMLRLSTKLGYKAFHNWYYTLSGEFKTQFFSKYDTNSDNLVSGLLSPAELNIGLGMDYKYVKDGVCNLSVLINPFNYSRYSVASDRVDPTKFNIEAGHKVENQWGSRLETTLKWNIITNLLWESRLSYTTNYEKVLAEWENTFTFAFNKYFSTKLFVHARFDDSVTLEPDDHSYFQLQELLSLGFNYSW